MTETKVIARPRKGGKTTQLCEHILETGGKWEVFTLKEDLAEPFLDVLVRLAPPHLLMSRKRGYVRFGSGSVSVGSHRSKRRQLAEPDTSTAIDNAHHMTPVELITFGSRYGIPDVVTLDGPAPPPKQIW